MARGKTGYGMWQGQAISGSFTDNLEPLPLPAPELARVAVLERLGLPETGKVPPEFVPYMNMAGDALERFLARGQAADWRTFIEVIGQLKKEMPTGQRPSEELQGIGTMAKLQERSAGDEK